MLSVSDPTSLALLDRQRRSAQMGFDNQAMGNGGVPLTDYLSQVHDLSTALPTRVQPQAARGAGGDAPDAGAALAGLSRAVGGGGALATPDSPDWTTPYGGDRLLASNAHELAEKQVFDQMHPEAEAFDKASTDRQNAMDAAKNQDAIDAGPGASMALRALQQHVADMAGVNEEQNREYWTPMSQGRRQQGIEDQLKLAQPKIDIADVTAGGKVGAAQALGDARTASAGIAAGSREGVANTAGAARIAASGYANQPEAAAVLQGLQKAAGAVPPVGSFGPEIEQRIAAASHLGVDRATAIAKLRQTGVIK